MRQLLTSRRLNRALPWIAGAVLVAGVLAFWQFRVGPNATEERFGTEPADTPLAQRAVPLEPEAQRVAVEFIKTAVVRKNLRRAWAISGPGIRQDLTLQEWMTGEIPVIPYPADVEATPVKIDWSNPGDAGLEVILYPRRGSKDEPQVFFIGVKKLDGRWVVDYWAPYEQTVVPSNT